MRENPLTSYVGRWVAFLLIPVIGGACAWLGAHGLDLDPVEVTAWVVGVVGGLTTWLYNRGKFEVAQATGISEETVEAIVNSVVATKLPQAPQSPAPGEAGAPAQPQGPPAGQ